MKLVRFGPRNGEKPGLVDEQGHIRDLSSQVGDLGGDWLSPSGLAQIRALDVRSLPIIAPQTRLGAPIAGSRNFIGIGLNYADHAAETGAPIPSEPIMFLKSLGTICGPNDDVAISESMRKVDWEVELAVIIGSLARDVTLDEALDHVAGYCICNDVSEREWQLERGGSWDKGKGYDNFGPLGPWLVTADEIADPQKLGMFLDVDGQAMQRGSTATMIFGVKEIISYVSQFVTLHPGDVITTGTPPGVGLGQKPPRFLAPGQTVRLGIDGLGEQQQRFVLRDRPARRDAA